MAVLQTNRKYVILKSNITRTSSNVTSIVSISVNTFRQSIAPCLDDLGKNLSYKV